MSNLSELDDELGDKPNKKKAAIPFQAWGHFFADIAADLIQSLLGFIPNGLNITYDCLLKKLPFIGAFFRHTWVEETLKFGCGITIGRGLSKDIGRYLLWPFGFVFGVILAPLLRRQPPKAYKNQLGHVFYQLSGQTVSGAIIGVLALIVGIKSLTHSSLASLEWQIWGLALCAGALVGLLAKSVMLLAMDAITRAQAASSRLNAKRAKKLGEILKEKVKERSHQKVYRYARDIIEQMHGPKVESQIQSFFALNHSKVCETTFTKIDRHLDYLSDRGVHGDMTALKKLMKLYRDFQQENGALDELIDRILNVREQHNLKNHVDNLYDRWNYQHLRKAA